MKAMTLVVRCEKCGHDTKLGLLVGEENPAPANFGHPSVAFPLPSTPVAKPKKGICGCGHDDTHHAEGSGQCLYGAGKVFGKCECTGYHAKRRGPSGAPKSEGSIGTCELEILAALNVPRSAIEVAIHAGYSPTSGGFQAALRNLRKLELVTGKDVGLEITPEGAAKVDRAPPSKLQRIERWIKRAGTQAGSVLTLLEDVYPEQLPAAEIATRTNYTVTSGGFQAALRKLVKMKLAIRERGLYRASLALMRDD